MSFSKKGTFTPALRLLVQLEDVNAAAALAPFGFTREEHERGWQKLHDAIAEALPASPPPLPERPKVPQAIAAVDRFENLWFPVADAALRDRAPQVHGQLFRDLGRTSGVEVLVTVHAFLDRIDAIAERAGDEAAEDHAENALALSVLSQRGLTEAVRAEGRELLATVTLASQAAGEPANGEGIVDGEHEVGAAKAALDAWYREWSTIARAGVTARRLRQRLGVSRRGRRRRRRAASPPAAADDAETPADEADAEGGLAAVPTQ